MKKKKIKVTEPFKTRLKKGDQVKVLIGKSRGEVGKVESFDPKRHRVFVAGLNVYKKHKKPDAQTNDTGGIVEKTMSMHISNVAFYDEKASKASRIGYKIEEGRKVRVAQASGTIV